MTSQTEIRKATIQTRHEAPAKAEDTEADAQPYECPECGAGHDGATTGTEWCPGCADEDAS